MRADHAFLLSRRPVPARRPSRAAGPRALRDVVTRSLALRARVEPRPEPRFDRLYDPLVADVVHGGPLSRRRFATAWSDAAALARLGEAKRAPFPAALARELAELHRRLGASAASLGALDRLARGEAGWAVCSRAPAARRATWGRRMLRWCSRSSPSRVWWSWTRDCPRSGVPRARSSTATSRARRSCRRRRARRERSWSERSDGGRSRT